MKVIDGNSLTKVDLSVVTCWQTNGAGESCSGKKLAIDLLTLGQSKALRASSFVGKAWQEFAVVKEDSAAVLLIGVPQKMSAADFRTLGNKIYVHAAKVNAKAVALSGEVGAELTEAQAAALFFGLRLSSYQIGSLKTKERESLFEISSLVINGASVLSDSRLKELDATVEGVFLARDLINMPANICTPQFLVETARAVAKKSGLTIEVFDRKALEKKQAGAFLAVAQGSDAPPFLVKLTLRSKKKNSPVVSLVGKGITFDTGGLSIKSSEGMLEMKGDMAGAAAVLGAMRTLSQLNPDVEVRGYLALAENMINGSAVRPGDVVRAANGLTVEIINTDAEGRLVLADTLAIADQDGADVIIDAATLTSACVAALGEEIAGIFSDDAELLTDIFTAGAESVEDFWQLPMPHRYESNLESDTADLKNWHSRWGGAIFAAQFLKQFVAKARWAHLDIAGPAFTTKNHGWTKSGGVGFGVATLVRYVMVKHLFREML